jgi:hypothetical protein
VEFDGRILPSEQILYGGTITAVTGADADWTKDMRKHQMLLMGQLKTWVIIHLDRFAKDVTSFVGALTKSAQSLKFTIPPPTL